MLGESKKPYKGKLENICNNERELLTKVLLLLLSLFSRV